MGTNFFRFVTIHAFDRRTDGQKGLAIRCDAVARSGISEM